MAYANTGLIANDISRGVLNRIFIDNGGVDTANYVDDTTFLAELVRKSKLSKDDADKIFPIPEAQDLADASEANKEGSLNLGFKTVLLEGRPAYKIKMFAGSSLAKALRKFNNQTVRIREYDANGNMAGTMVGSKFYGFKAKLFFTGNKIATGQAVEEGIEECTVSILSTSEYFDNVKFIGITGNIDNVVGLNDAAARLVSKAANVYKVAFEIPKPQPGQVINVADQYSTALASSSLFTAFTGAGFATPLAITSVTYDAAAHALAVTFDSTAFNALASGAAIRLVPAAPTALDTANVPGVELASIVLTK